MVVVVGSGTRLVVDGGEAGLMRLCMRFGEVYGLWIRFGCSHGWGRWSP